MPYPGPYARAYGESYAKTYDCADTCTHSGSYTYADSTSFWRMSGRRNKYSDESNSTSYLEWQKWRHILREGYLERDFW